MWWTTDITSKVCTIVRYSGVRITDRRQNDPDYATQVDDLFDITFSELNADCPLSKDPVWKGLVEKFGRLGYDLSAPVQVTRLEKTFSVGDSFYWDFDRYDSEQREKAETLCLPS